MKRRRQSEVLRNLDDRLRVFGLLSFKSLLLLVALYQLNVAVDLLTGFWRAAFGRFGILLETALFAGLGLLLAIVERQDDEHLVPAMVRYGIERPWRWIFTGFAADGWKPPRLDWIVARGWKR